MSAADLRARHEWQSAPVLAARAADDYAEIRRRMEELSRANAITQETKEDKTPLGGCVQCQHDRTPCQGCCFGC